MELKLLSMIKLDDPLRFTMWIQQKNNIKLKQVWQIWLLIILLLLNIE